MKIKKRAILILKEMISKQLKKRSAQQISRSVTAHKNCQAWSAIVGHNAKAVTIPKTVMKGPEIDKGHYSPGVKGN
jgi:hypothetical protein